jgi:hypothetical protein
MKLCIISLECNMMNANLLSPSSRARGGMIRSGAVNNVALAGLWVCGGIIRRLRFAPPSVIHDVAASAAKN